MAEEQEGQEQQEEETQDEAQQEASAEEEQQGEEQEASGEEESEEAESPKGKTAAQLREELRKSDRTRKRESKRKDDQIAKLQADLKKLQDKDKSDQEKALEQAKAEGRDAALAESRKERRGDRLALAVSELAVKGIKTGDDEKADPTKFKAKPTLIMLENAIAAGEVDASEIFDDNDKVRGEGLREAVASFIEDEEWLASKPEATRTTRSESDAGKGGSGSKSLEEMTPDDHLKQIQRR